MTATPAEEHEAEENMATYPRAGASEVPAQPDFPELSFWNAHGSFGQSI